MCRQLPPIEKSPATFSRGSAPLVRRNAVVLPVASTYKFLTVKPGPPGSVMSRPWPVQFHLMVANAWSIPEVIAMVSMPLICSVDPGSQVQGAIFPPSI